MDQKPTIYLHVGAHKTGTTSIQHFFNKNFKNLRDLGVLYPKTLRKIKGNRIHFAHHDFAWFLGFGNRISRLKQTESFGNRLLKEHINAKTQSIFISSEAFEAYNASRNIKKLIKIFPDFDVKVLFYVRRQDKIFESAFKQRVKTGFTKTFDEFLTLRIKNYYEQISTWARFFGKENMIIKVFDDEGVKTNLIPDLLKTLKIEDISSFQPEDFLHQNMAFSNDHTDLIQILNSANDEKVNDQVFKFFKAYNSSNKIDKDSSTYYTKDSLKRVYDDHLKFNEKLKEEFLPDHETLFKWNIEEELDKIQTHKRIEVEDKILNLLTFGVKNFSVGVEDNSEED